VLIKYAVVFHAFLIKCQYVC